MAVTIKADFTKMKKTISAINDYLKALRQNTNEVNDEVETVRFNTADYDQLKKSWELSKENGTIYENIRKMLESYKGNVEYAMKRYQKAQSNVVAKSETLPRY